MSMNHAVQKFLSESHSKQMKYTKSDFVGLAISEASDRDLADLAKTAIEVSEAGNKSYEILMKQLAQCTLRMVEFYAETNYPDQWKIKEDQELDRAVRLIAVNPNQEHINTVKKESIREFTRAHNDALGART